MSDLTPQAPRYIEVEPLPVEVFLPPPQRKQRYWLHVLLLVITLFTTMMVGTRFEANYLQGRPVLTLGDDLVPFFPIGYVLEQPSRILMGIPFSLSLMLILLAHEMGHYIYCLRYGVYATLPYFIPAPTLIGTMGAFIRIKSPIRSRQALFDIGIAGPIAGFVVAILVLLWSFTLAKPAPGGISQGDIAIGYPLIFKLVHWFVMGSGLQAIALDHLLLHPTAIAAWVGMFATAMNLLPGGQLDGGHIIYALAPWLHRHVSRLTVGALIPMGILLWKGWLIWALLLTISGMRHPSVPEWPDVSPGRRLLGLCALAMFLVTIAPVPLAEVVGR
jgi:membrane-associated protease RseP (regulator of RpoE activity)